MQSPEAKKYCEVLLPVCFDEQLLGDIRCLKKPFVLAGHSEQKRLWRASAISCPSLGTIQRRETHSAKEAEVRGEREKKKVAISH